MIYKFNLKFYCKCFARMIRVKSKSMKIWSKAYYLFSFRRNIRRRKAKMLKSNFLTLLKERLNKRLKLDPKSLKMVKTYYNNQLKRRNNHKLQSRKLQMINYNWMKSNKPNPNLKTMLRNIFLWKRQNMGKCL